jgi:hypothetical protein
VDVKSISQGKKTAVIIAKNPKEYQGIVNVQFEATQTSIDARLDTDKLVIGDTTILTIVNYNQLEGVKIDADDNFVGVGLVNKEGVTVITAKKLTESTTIIITADNVQQLTITMKIISREI